jgi:hypothetical protein
MLLTEPKQFGTFYSNIEEFLGTRCGVVVKALCYKQHGPYLTLPATLGPGVHSASNRNEYQKQKNVLGK